jgi:hypothetical protein
MEYASRAAACFLRSVTLAASSKFSSTGRSGRPQERSTPIDGFDLVPKNPEDVRISCRCFAAGNVVAPALDSAAMALSR